MVGDWHENDLSVNEQVAIIEEEERRFRESERVLAQQQHDAEMSLHNISGASDAAVIFGDDVPDGDLSHMDQQAGSRKTRVLPGPNDGPDQSRIDEALELATQHASENASSFSSIQLQSQASSSQPSSAPANPPQSSQSSQPSGGGGRTRGKASGKSDDIEGEGSGGNRQRRAAPYPGPRKSSS